MASQPRPHKVLKTEIGSALTMKYDASGTFLFTGGTDCAIHLWNVERSGDHDPQALLLERNAPATSSTGDHDDLFDHNSSNITKLWLCMEDSSSHVASFSRTKKGSNDSTSSSSSSSSSQSNGHTNAITCIDIASDGSFLYSAGYDSFIGLWDISNQYMIRHLSGGHKGSITCLSMVNNHTPFLTTTTTTGMSSRQQKGSIQTTTDYRLLASGSTDGHVCLWDIRQQRPIQYLSDASDSISSIQCNDRLIMVSSLDGCIYTYDIRQSTKLCDKVCYSGIIDMVYNYNSNTTILQSQQQQQQQQQSKQPNKPVVHNDIVYLQCLNIPRQLMNDNKTPNQSEPSSSSSQQHQINNTTTTNSDHILSGILCYKLSTGTPLAVIPCYDTYSLTDTKISLSLCADQHGIITGSQNGYIHQYIWDTHIPHYTTIKHNKLAHPIHYASSINNQFTVPQTSPGVYSPVTTVAAHPTIPSSFSSASLDGVITIWK